MFSILFLFVVVVSFNRLFLCSCRKRRFDDERLGVRFCFLISGICFFYSFYVLSFNLDYAPFSCVHFVMCFILFILIHLFFISPIPLVSF